jgi:hypothetical protein
MQLEAVISELKALRITKGMTLDEIARAAGWANASIPARIEAKDSNPTCVVFGDTLKQSGAKDIRTPCAAAPLLVAHFFQPCRRCPQKQAQCEISATPLCRWASASSSLTPNPNASLTRWLGAFKRQARRHALTLRCLALTTNLRLASTRHAYGMDPTTS